jgi:peptidoglycan hydrolase CwlO-like protein
MNSRTTKQKFAAATAAVVATLAVVCALGLGSTAASGASLGQLNSELGQQQARQHTLASSLASLSGLIGSLDSQISLVQSREAAVQTELDHDRAQLLATRAALQREQARIVKLRGQLAHSRMLLARQLLSSYENARPDIVSVVLEAHGFTDLLDKLDFLHQAERQQQSTIAFTRRAKAEADSAARRLAKLETTDRRIADQTELHVRALAGMNALLQSRQAALARAKIAQQDALAASRARGRQLQSAIARVEAQQAAAARAAAAAIVVRSVSTASGPSGAPTPVGPTFGPSGGWAIPYAIVLCESGGQNLTPNSAGASGYYQIIPGTWKLFGGSGPAAYQASKSEQDAVASRIWNGGAGASNWVCAGIVGITHR